MSPRTCWCDRQRHPHHVHRPADSLTLALLGPLAWFVPFCPATPVPMPVLDLPVWEPRTWWAVAA